MLEPSLEELVEVAAELLSQLLDDRWCDPEVALHRHVALAVMAIPVGGHEPEVQNVSDFLCINLVGHHAFS